MQQSPENFEALEERVKNAKADDERFQFSERYLHPGKYAGDWKGFSNPMDASRNQAFLRAWGIDVDSAEKRLNKYKEEGQAEAIALNEQYETLRDNVLQKQEDLQEYAEAHQGVVDENTPGFQQLSERIQFAVDAVDAFAIEKLGISPKEEPREAI